MTKAEQAHHSRVKRFLDLCLEDVLETSDKDIVESLKREGLDPRETAQVGRDLVSKALKRHGEDFRKEARRVYNQNVTALKRNKPALPRTFQEKLALLKSCLMQHRYLRPALLTTQHRSVNTLTQTDLDSLLQQLYYLGLLGKVEK